MGVSQDQLKEANIIQLKNWIFSLAWQMKPQVAFGWNKYKGLYAIAKQNIGMRSLLFGLDAYKKQRNRERGVPFLFLGTLLDSLEVQERHIRFNARSARWRTEELIHDEIQLQHFADITVDVSKMTSIYKPSTKQIAQAFFEEEKADTLLVLADSLEEECNADEEAMHFRTYKYHSPACPVIQKILKQ